MTNESLGIIGGSGFLDGLDPDGLGVEVERRVVDGVHLHHSEHFVFLQRHGEGVPHLPHEIPHHAHIRLLAELGVRKVVGLTSTGTLRPEIEPGTLVIPDDYLSRHPPPTFGEHNHILPELDEGLQGFLATVAREVVRTLPSAPAIHLGGVYAETRGPRFETRAEVRSLARDAHIVGMTAASEATLAQEMGLRYAILGIVDNWAHGVGPLSLDDFRERRRENRTVAAAILLRILKGAGE
jgi:5'-methylthioadenosine phosphorylase